MTTQHRIEAVSNFGFTERQARFLVTVMLNGGVCVPRQYAEFVGTAYGQNVNAFFDKLVDRRFAVECSCVHNRARVYQLRYQPLYSAVGEPNSPNRKPIAAAGVMERLMLLDAIVSQPELIWVSTVADKMALFTVATSCAPERLPHKSVGEVGNGRLQLFPDALPIGIQNSCRPVFIFVVNTWNTDDLRAFLQRHADLLESLTGWTLLLVLPRHLAMVKTSFEAVVRDELASPLSAVALAELRWYFEQRRDRKSALHSADPDRFRRTERAFAGARWRILFRRWLSDGDSALNVATSPALREALARGSGMVECEVLRHSYRHLSPLASLVRPRVKGLRRGNEPSEALNACRENGRRRLPPIKRGSELRS
jgi:hypothetical protein